jgi:hypothetical protein
MVKTGFSARWQAACATKRASRTCFQLGFAPEKNNISEEKPSILSMKKAFSTLGYRLPTKTKNKAAFHSLLEGN